MGWKIAHFADGGGKSNRAKLVVRRLLWTSADVGGRQHKVIDTDEVSGRKAGKTLQAIPGHLTANRNSCPAWRGGVAAQDDPHCHQKCRLVRETDQRAP